ncbi:MAG: tRNA (adenosine(37)-N6)-threonylcarbamoyltransferase complex transferase subunit TsaD [Phycisphaerae bacterium]|nr:tRNA (adenosine(37)-N6)-threonylcarbamoyltransferase complex transferase subunit TsaD [Phycisphaerae bacterium]
MTEASGRSWTVLGIESSCEETAAAVVVDQSDVLSSIVMTQHELHEQFSGVVPEIASRAHVQRILPAVEMAMERAGCAWDQIDGIAVGNRPGLIGSLLVGVTAAKTLAWMRNLPLVGVDHVESHIWSVRLGGTEPELPALGLVISGGHSNIYFIDESESITLIGRTIDDAMGEALDKAATILDLGYPGGPRLERCATDGDPSAYRFPVSRLGKESLDFSFSGLKTSLLYEVRGRPSGRGGNDQWSAPPPMNDQRRADLAASFQHAAIEAVRIKLTRAIQQHGVRSLLAGGGVTANGPTRRMLQQVAEEHQARLHLPMPEYCMDNAAMIASLGTRDLRRGRRDDLALTAAAT